MTHFAYTYIMHINIVIASLAMFVCFDLQCKKVRDHYISDPRERRRLDEKARASMLFKGKKSLYPKS